MSDKALRRVRTALTASDGHDARYTPRPRLAKRELSAWEARYGVKLPDEYRVFLCEIGNGGTMPGSYCDFVVEPLAKVQGGPTAATPFPVSRHRLRERFRQLETEGRPADGVLFPELEAFWDEGERPPGCLEFGQYPSADSLLLVTAGDLRGSVWCGVCAGIPETDRAGKLVGFLTWFANTLAELTEPPAE
jgi:hypothetical protein